MRRPGATAPGGESGSRDQVQVGGLGDSPAVAAAVLLELTNGGDQMVKGFGVDEADADWMVLVVVDLQDHGWGLAVAGRGEVGVHTQGAVGRPGG